MKRLMLLVVVALVNAPALATAEITTGSIVEQVQATGRLEAVTTVEVGAQVSGKLRPCWPASRQSRCSWAASAS